MSLICILFKGIRDKNSTQNCDTAFIYQIPGTLYPLALEEKKAKYVPWIMYFAGQLLWMAYLTDCHW